MSEGSSSSAMQDSWLRDLDIHDPALAENPCFAYDAQRCDRPLAYGSYHGGFRLSRYENANQAALDWRAFTSSAVSVTATPIITPRTETMLPIELDPPRGTRFHPAARA